MEKHFDRWNGEKQKIERTTFADFVHMREVWWCSLGVNIGAEENGNEEFFERPVLVVRKFNQDMVLVVPLTSQPKRTPYHFVFPYNGTQVAAVISQLRLVSTKRLKRRMYQMPDPLFDAVRSAVQRMISAGF
jgi:mRNA interferase MazF